MKFEVAYTARSSSVGHMEATLRFSCVGVAKTTPVVLPTAELLGIHDTTTELEDNEIYIFREQQQLFSKAKFCC